MKFTISWIFPSSPHVGSRLAATQWLYVAGDLFSSCHCSTNGKKLAFGKVRKARTSPHSRCGCCPQSTVNYSVSRKVIPKLPQGRYQTFIASISVDAPFLNPLQTRPPKCGRDEVYSSTESTMARDQQDSRPIRHLLDCQALRVRPLAVPIAYQRDWSLPDNPKRIPSTVLRTP